MKSKYSCHGLASGHYRNLRNDIYRGSAIDEFFHPRANLKSEIMRCLYIEVFGIDEYRRR